MLYKATHHTYTQTHVTHTKWFHWHEVQEQQRKSMVIENRKSSGCLGEVGEVGAGVGIDWKCHEETFWGDENILYLVLTSSYTMVTTVTRHWPKHLRFVHFIPEHYISVKLYTYTGLLRWLGGKESTCKCRRHRRHVRSLGQEDPLEEEMATHSCILSWTIWWTEELCGQQSMGLQRGRPNWATEYARIHIHTQWVPLGIQ